MRAQDNADRFLEEIEKNIGLRTLTVSRDEDVWGGNLRFK